MSRGRGAGGTHPPEFGVAEQVHPRKAKGTAPSAREPLNETVIPETLETSPVSSKALQNAFLCLPGYYPLGLRSVKANHRGFGSRSIATFRDFYRLMM